MLLRDLVAAWYVKLGVNYKSVKICGQIYFTYVLYSYENSEIWRPCETDGTGTQASRFRIIAAGQDAYDRPLPLKSPHLPSNEEFPVLRAKRRPAVLIRPAIEVDKQAAQGLPGGSKPLPMILPLYGVADATGAQKYPAEFLGRVQSLEYPSYFFFPNGGPLDKDSIAPLFRMAHSFDGHLEPTQWKLSDDILRILQGQIANWFTGTYEGDYRAARDVLLEGRD